MPATPERVWRALAARRSNPGGDAGDDARVIEGEATLETGENAICHNKGYTDEGDKSVIDQRLNVNAPLKQSADADE